MYVATQGQSNARAGSWRGEVYFLVSHCPLPSDGPLYVQSTFVAAVLTAPDNGDGDAVDAYAEWMVDDDDNKIEHMAGTNDITRQFAKQTYLKTISSHSSPRGPAGE